MNEASDAGRSDCEIRIEGCKALTERLGVSGAIRFLTLCAPAIGDYTKERGELFADLTLEEVLRRIEQAPRNP